MLQRKVLRMLHHGVLRQARSGGQPFCTQPLSEGHSVFNVTSKNFATEVVQSRVPIILYMHAGAPSKQPAPALESLLSNSTFEGKFRLGKRRVLSLILLIPSVY